MRTRLLVQLGATLAAGGLSQFRVLAAAGIELPLPGRSSSTPETRVEFGKSVQAQIVGGRDAVEKRIAAARPALAPAAVAIEPISGREAASTLRLKKASLTAGQPGERAASQARRPKSRTVLARAMAVERRAAPRSVGRRIRAG